MSWLDDSKYDAVQYDSESPFIGRAVGPGESLVITFKSILDKERPDDTKFGKPGDTYYLFCFEDENGKERLIEQNSPKGSFFKAMRSAQVKEGEKVKITRSGENVDTRWKIEKNVDGEWKSPVADSEIPF